MFKHQKLNPGQRQWTCSLHSSALFCSRVFVAEINGQMAEQKQAKEDPPQHSGKMFY